MNIGNVKTRDEVYHERSIASEEDRLLIIYHADTERQGKRRGTRKGSPKKRDASYSRLVRESPEASSSSRSAFRKTTYALIGSALSPAF